MCGIAGLLDPSPAGSQPMLFTCGRFVIVYNGEVFNACELRAEVEQVRGAVARRGHSDTEAIIEAIAAWGASPLPRG